MDAWLGQYCINVTDLDRAVRFYETLGLTNTSRTDIPAAVEAIVEEAGGKGGRIQLAQQKESTGPIDHGNAFWKLYVNTNDIERLHRSAVDAGYRSESPPVRLERWPTTVGFLRDPDGYLVELVQRHPWLDGDDRTYAWVGQYCVYVSDLARTIRFYETLGLTCTSQTDIPNVRGPADRAPRRAPPRGNLPPGHSSTAGPPSNTDHREPQRTWLPAGALREAILENGAGRGGKIQLAQKLDDDAPIGMGTAMWKLYVYTDDCEALHRAAVDAGHAETMKPTWLERWNVTVSFVLDPDGYQVELVQRHAG